MLKPIEEYYRLYGPQLNRYVFFSRDEPALQRLDILPQNGVHFNSDTGSSDVYWPDVIKTIYSNDDYTDNLMQVLNNKSQVYIVFKRFKTDKAAEQIFTWRKSSLLKFTLDQIENLDEEQKQRAAKVVEWARENADATKLMFSQDTYTCKMGNRTLTFPVHRLALLFLKDFSRLYNGDISFIEQDEQLHWFLYAALSWAKQENVFSKYIFSDPSEVFMYNLNHNNIEDFSTVNRLNESVDEYTDGAEVDEELYEFLTRDMPKSFNRLEQSMYMYLRMVSVLNYDEGFYASNQAGKARNFHGNLEHIRDITLQNAGIVCYEFPVIMIKYFKEKGIHYNYHNPYKEYGQGHVDLWFKANGIIVNVEPLYSVLDGDFTRIRLGGDIHGLSCQNDSSISQTRFKESFEKVKAHFFKNDFKNNYVGSDFETFKNQYKLLSNAEIEVSLSDKLTIIKQRLVDINEFPGLIRHIYIKKLCDCVFEKEVYEGKLEQIIIAEKVEGREDTDYLTSSITAIKRGTSKDGNEKFYYLKTGYDGTFEFVTKKHLEDGFASGHYMCLNDYSRTVPGIEMSKVKGE